MFLYNIYRSLKSIKNTVTVLSVCRFKYCRVLKELCHLLRIFPVTTQLLNFLSMTAVLYLVVRIKSCVLSSTKSSSSVPLVENTMFSLMVPTIFQHSEMAMWMDKHSSVLVSRIYNRDTVQVTSQLKRKCLLYPEPENEANPSFY